jgi:hypothetical protein
MSITVRQATQPTAAEIAAYKSEIATAVSDGDERLRALALTFLHIVNGMAAQINAAVPGADIPTYTAAQLRSAILSRVRDPN